MQWGKYKQEMTYESKDQEGKVCFDTIICFYFAFYPTYQMVVIMNQNIVSNKNQQQQ